MFIRAGYEIHFEAQIPTAMLALLSVHPSRNKHLTTPQRIRTWPEVPIYDYGDGYGNICSRFTAPAGGVAVSCDFIIEDDGQPDVRAPDGPQAGVESYPDEALIYLLGSRYCETDLLMDVAWSNFGHLASARDRVEAIVAFVHGHLRFGYEHARSNKTAWHGLSRRHPGARGQCPHGFQCMVRRVHPGRLVHL